MGSNTFSPSALQVVLSRISYFRRIWEFRDLFLVFVWREFSVRYKHTLIGAAWAVIQPLSMMLLFTFVFSFVLKMKVSNYPYAVFFYSGLLPWMFFDSAIKYSVPSFTAHYGLITKIYFPREIIPFSCISVAVVDFLISFVVYLFLLLFFDIPLTVNIFYLLPLLFCMILFIASASLILACLNVFYRDVRLAINFIMQLWFFATPVFYSTTQIKGTLKYVLYLNPMTFFIEGFRSCTLYGQPVDLGTLTLFTVLTFTALLITLKLFVRVERLFADVL
ncbi:ABC-2 type transporter [Geobacter metallireducens RCH3]|uniref:Transport permease protein n=1 Tax=Geobacter metallireducens (strain ATCC 53774 / DSM 7210 / GS-15) TaxID=269799 RepID=Q39VT4_GEOMG|nr:ABC transporter permease [Geobacter metallireducens]ABB31640.1 ABC transporter, membrane protein, ABC-2 family [Geobacter metallireducens GS-15]EHP89482.1 ABC-2 type transporter [Geobacter metallireducens RCH3]